MIPEPYRTQIATAHKVRIALGELWYQQRPWGPVPGFFQMVEGTEAPTIGRFDNGQLFITGLNPADISRVSVDPRSGYAVAVGRDVRSRFYRLSR